MTWLGEDRPTVEISALKLVLLYVLSGGLVFVYMNLIIHQIGFYELFFTDIMRGSAEAKEVAEAFLAEYGQKHRHLGHGLFHGAINGFALSLPFVAFFSLVENLPKKKMLAHIGYWMLVSILVGSLVSEFV